MAGGNLKSKVQVKLRGDLQAYLVNAATDIFTGAPVGINAAGKAIMATGAEPFVGMAEQPIAAAIADGTTVKTLVRRTGHWWMPMPTVTQASIAQLVAVATAQTASADYTVAVGTTNVIGTVVEVDLQGKRALVDIEQRIAG